MTIEERLLMGPALFELAVESIAAGIRAKGREARPDELRAAVYERFHLRAEFDGAS